MIVGLINDLIAFQRDIYLAFGERIRLYAQTGDWSQLAVFLPMGIVFGAVHAMAPGHSKVLLAAYTAATPGSPWHALRTAFILSAVHVSVSVLIVLLSLPLVSIAFGASSPTPLLDRLSRGLIGLIGLWMIWSALRGQRHTSNTGRSGAFAVFAGLIPCPLTLFVMAFAVTQGVVVAGLAFSLVMLTGIALVLGAVALGAALARQGLLAHVFHHERTLIVTARLLQTATGLLLLFVAVNATLLH